MNNLFGNPLQYLMPSPSSGYPDSIRSSNLSRSLTNARSCDATGSRNNVQQQQHDGHHSNILSHVAPDASVVTLNHQFSTVPMNHLLSNIPQSQRLPAQNLGPSVNGAVTNTTEQNNNDDDDISKLPELRERIRNHVDTIIRSSGVISLEDAAAYMEATSIDAELVRTETDPVQFVRYCGYDLWAGAKRLCCYWTERKKAFGPQRAFLPLTLTGTGALSKEDLSTINGGFPAFLPESPTQPKSLLLDRRKYIPDESSSMENKLRCLFYVMSVLAEDDRAQIEDEGVAVLMALVTPRACRLNIQWTRICAYMIRDVFPVRTKLHLLNILPRQKKESFIHGTVSMMCNLIREYALPKYKIYIHSQRGDPTKTSDMIPLDSMNAENEQEITTGTIVEDFIKLGFTRKQIPLCFGGEWKYDDFFRWCRKRREWENEKYQGRLLLSEKSIQQPGTQPSGMPQEAGGRGTGVQQLPAQVAVASAPSPTTGTATTSASSSQGKKRSKPKIDPDERVRKRRLISMIHSRRKRERKENHVKFLKEESLNLTKEHRALTAEHDRLKQLVERAKGIAEHCQR